MFDLFREANALLAPAVAGILCWRVTRQWALLWVASHARPWTRSVLLTLALVLLIAGAGARQYEATAAQAGPVSPAMTLACLLVLGMCIHWPRPLRGDIDART